jgi:outer membrane receptor protein involved in Fe transport
VIYSTNNNEENGFTTNSYIDPPLTPEQIKEFSKINDKDFSVQSDYSHPFGKESKLETGFKSRYRDKENDYTNQKFDSASNQYITDPNLTNDFKYNDWVNAVYAQYSSKISIFSWQLGTRVEQTNTKSLLASTNQETKKDYIDFFPSANASAQLGKSTELQFSYSRRIRRPSLGELNPFMNTSDPNNYFSGNANLRPEYTDSYELGFVQYLPGSTTLNPSVFYTQTKDLISRTREYIDSNTTLTSFVNYASSKTYGVELIFNSQPVPFWNINGSVSYFQNDIDATNINSEFVNDGNSWSGRVSSSLFLPAQFSLQLNYFYSGKIIAAQANIDPFQSFDAALRKDFLDGKLSATLKASDIFNTLKFKVNIDNDPRFSETLMRKRDTRTLTLTLNYKFGEADKNQQRRRRDSNRDNQGNDGPGF